MQILSRTSVWYVFIKVQLFLFLLISTQCLADEADIAQIAQAKGVQRSEIDDSIEKVQNNENVANDTPESYELVLPIQTISPNEIENVTDGPVNDNVVSNSAETSNNNSPVHEKKTADEIDNPTNLVESEQNLPRKERVNLLPEEQSAGGLYGKQVAHVPGNRVSPPQSPLSSFASIFGGFRRAVVGSANANLASDDPEVERAEKLKNGFEKMIQLVNILGQVDSFLSDRTRSVVRRLSMLADADDDDRYRRSSHYRRHHY